MVSDQTQTRGARALTVALAVVFFVALSGVFYLAITPQQQADAHTELYVLGSDGVAGGHPTNTTVGEEGEFIVGATNNEHQEMTYTVVVEAGETRFAEERFTIDDGETWEEEITIAFGSAGTRRVEIYLYRGRQVEGSIEPHREVWFDIKVRG